MENIANVLKQNTDVQMFNYAGAAVALAVTVDYEMENIANVLKQNTGVQMFNCAGAAVALTVSVHINQN
ncbi:unnamed protein product [Gongylonema pulchrum]|uniref:Glutaminase n=1 Tax=Gongylonema pulchrum TaxID=637853 RepID=A0A183DYA1_9BILA|nr:unnamed protein product [Gongylonema pulchrum]